MFAFRAVLPHHHTCLPQSVLSSQLNTSTGYAGVSYFLLVWSCNDWEEGTVMVWELGAATLRAQPLCVLHLVSGQGAVLFAAMLMPV